MQTTFDHLYDHYHNDLYQYVFYMVKNQHVAEDIVQEVYIKVLKSYHNFRGESSEKTWLFSIARHTTMDYFRKQQRQKSKLATFFNKEQDLTLIKDKDPLPEEVAQLNDELKRIYQLLDHCTLDQKNVLILRYIQSLSIHETAQILEWSESKVKTTQHRAIKKLQELIGED
ncbi:RNA polymerase sigma factor SigX [Amphibacillus xylanus]|uniref:RNA polymerase sigma factor n=1 Tax=Amphibacillus xylanus (strain ATCC 51415 / DSM 6626 / JCM 7361 / LMG 17667 / NBRC 15112 / Ep01) TaxID=698758 RepID=K0IXX6_AMPXN|nr:RNA polymerase sigma factor SigX [Amphibacillus xylanus]BAM47350.1 putative RNA polymerase ECF-type sigma factor [Amphibacillus xylanus NBRC 15112]